MIPSRDPAYLPESLVLEDVSNHLGQRASDNQSTSTKVHDSEPPEHAVSILPRWNDSRSNIFKTMSTFFGFLVMGANDAIYGAIIPYLQTYYHVSYTVVSLVFLSPMVGYISAAALNNLLHQKVGQRGVAMIGPGSHLVAYIVISLHPPYSILVVTFILAGFGNGLLDAAWNAWLVSWSPALLIMSADICRGTWQTQMRSLVSFMLSMGSVPQSLL